MSLCDLENLCWYVVFRAKGGLDSRLTVTAVRGFCIVAQLVQLISEAANGDRSLVKRREHCLAPCMGPSYVLCPLAEPRYDHNDIDREGDVSLTWHGMDTLSTNN